MQKVYRNTAIFIILIMIGIQWGFYRTYTSEFPNFIDKTITIHVHGILLMTWMVLLIVQPLLINAGKAQLHRTIGKVSYVLGPLIIISLFLVGKGGYGRGIASGAPEQEMLAVMVLDIRGLVSFAIFWALAMFYRKDSNSHMRYMIATGLLAIGPGVGRGLISSGVEFPNALTITDVLDLAIVGCLLGFDIYRKKNYKPFLVVFIVFLIGGILWQLRDNAAWQSFAKSYAAMFY